MQVKNAAGQWVSAEPIPGTLVCNIGDMLRVWTHGLYQVAPVVSSVGSRICSHACAVLNFWLKRHVSGSDAPCRSLLEFCNNGMTACGVPHSAVMSVLNLRSPPRTA